MKNLKRFWWVYAVSALLALVFVAVAREIEDAKPSISAEQKATWFKAVAQWNATGAPLQQKLQQSEAEMKATCEKNSAYTLGDGKDGDPDCILKPKPAAEKKK